MVKTHPPQLARAGILDDERFERSDLRAMLAVLTAATRIVAEGDAVLRRQGADIRLVEFDVLAFVYVSGAMRPSEILRRASLSASPPTVHNIIRRLERRGLVERSPHPDDARGVLVNITDAGRALMERDYPLIERYVIDRFASQYSAEELLTIAGLLERT
jgi:DNA-binding MarR family transcriptional regulator